MKCGGRVKLSYNVRSISYESLSFLPFLPVHRLLSNQFCHSSLQHIGYNSIMLLLFGYCCEMYNGWFHTMLVFEAGVLFGTLAFSIASPYVGLVGCSHGVAGLLGGIVPNLIVNFDVFDSAAWIGFTIFVALSIFAEVINYYLMRVEGTAYTAHLFGFIGGFVVGLALVRVIKHSATISYRWKYGLKLIGSFSTIAIFSGLILKFSLQKWPPIDLSAYDPPNKMHCCERVFYIMKTSGESLEEVFNRTYRCG